MSDFRKVYSAINWAWCYFKRRSKVVEGKETSGAKCDLCDNVSRNGVFLDHELLKQA